MPDQLVISQFTTILDGVIILTVRPPAGTGSGWVSTAVITGSDGETPEDALRNFATLIAKLGADIEAPPVSPPATPPQNRPEPNVRS